MAIEKLILRTVNSPYSGDVTTNKVLSWDNLDNNFLNLKGLSLIDGLISGNTLVLTKANGDIINIDISDISVDTPSYWISGSSGNYSVKANNDSGLDATGNYAVAEGRGTTASGDYSHAEGDGTTADGYVSHTEGLGTYATGEASHAEFRYAQLKIKYKTI